MQQIYTPQQSYKVLVHTITYNQSTYVTDTLDGVAMQHTNFPLVHYVIDDCSTDGEQKVIKSWLNEHCDMDKAEYIDLELAQLILVPHKTNKNLSFAIYLLKRNLWKEPKLKQSLVTPWREHCEYEAFCEGDDYWTDPLKLQKQVDWMENHPEYSMCCSNALFQYPKYSKSHNKYLEDCDISVEDMVLQGGGLVDTCTIIFRKEILNSYPKACQNGPYGDYPLQIHCAIIGKVRYMCELMGTYRQLAIGSWTVNKLKQGDTPLDISRLHFFMDFMKALDDESGYKYHNIFKCVRIREMYKVLAHYKPQWHEIRKMYPDEVSGFDRYQKTEDTLTCAGFFVIATFYGVYHNQGLVRAFLTLPVIHSLYNGYVTYRQRNLFHDSLI